MFNQQADFPLLDHPPSAIPALSPSLPLCYQPPYLSKPLVLAQLPARLPINYLAIFFQAGVAVLPLVYFALFSILGIPYRDFFFLTGGSCAPHHQYSEPSITPALVRKIPIAAVQS